MNDPAIKQSILLKGIIKMQQLIIGFIMKCDRDDIKADVEEGCGVSFHKALRRGSDVALLYRIHGGFRVEGCVGLAGLYFCKYKVFPIARNEVHLAGACLPVAMQNAVPLPFQESGRDLLSFFTEV